MIMFKISLIFFSTVGFSIAGEKSLVSLFTEDYEEGQRFFFFPDGNGDLHLVDIEEQKFEPRFNAISDIKFLLFTRDNPYFPKYIVKGDRASLENSKFNKDKPIKFIAHGWRNDGLSDVNTILIDAFLAAQDVNVICIDWGKGSNGLYTSAVMNVPKAGKHLANLLDWLIEEGVQPNKFHLMGHSLGAHLVAIASRSTRNGAIPIITAFDPANPLWGGASDRIRQSDADYVEVIHTNAGNLGLKYPVGDNDFYPNGGSRQPGCSFFSIGCSHSRSYEYYADSLDHSAFSAYQCKDYDELSRGKCSNIGIINMGGTQVKPSLGVFYLETNDRKPFCKH